ncbi:hypothetical protein RD792_007749 [Penstemon davidsonii]|uniref:Pentatricopeptide repeat-containing protein n=1 Tax=Penstemon davidsonii TaxID=160366 RepID=A0ABR0D8A1_9LAMI|nr:hypothetical protein RD792_007749 [Penstemon davidsonii]
MTSTVCRRLRSVFQRKPTIAIAATTSTDDDFNKLVEQFKKKSDSRDFRGNRFAYAYAVRRLAKAGHFSSINEILSHQKQYQQIHTERFTSRLIRLYGQAKMLDHAHQLFDEMPELNCPRTVLSFNALLAACIYSKSFDKIIELFRELPKKLSIKPDIISYATLMKAYCETGLFDEAVSLLDEIEKNDWKPNAVIFNTLLDTFYKSGKFSEAENIWDLMKQKNSVPDVRSYTSRLLGMVNENRLSEAVDVLKEMEEMELKPNAYTYNGLIKGFVDEGDLEEVKKWYGLMMENGCSPDFLTFMILIPFACDKDDFDFAYELCKKSIQLKEKLSDEVVQKVADGLIDQSQVGKAKELMELGNL